MRRFWMLLLLCALGTGCAAGVRSSPAVSKPRPKLKSVPVELPGFGFKAPVLLQGVSFTHRWVAACFALNDTDHNGKLEVSVGRHGETFGDQTEPYLLLDGAPPEIIDDYLGSSPERRFVAFVQEGRLSVVDVQSKRRRDLSALGADLTDRLHPALPHPAIAFSADKRAVVVRRSVDQSQVLLIDLLSDAADVVYETTDDVARLQFIDDKLTVWTLPRGTVDDSPHTNLARRHCRGAPGSYLRFRSKKDPTVPVDVPLPSSSRLKAQAEEIHGGLGCTDDDGEVLASSADDRRHLVATLLSNFKAELGPLRWAVGSTRPYSCPPRE